MFARAGGANYRIGSVLRVRAVEVRSPGAGTLREFDARSSQNCRHSLPRWLSGPTTAWHRSSVSPTFGGHWRLSTCIADTQPGGVNDGSGSDAGAVGAGSWVSFLPSADTVAVDSFIEIRT